MAIYLFQNQFSLENCENVNERITEYFSRRGHTNISSGAGNENNVLYTAQKTLRAFVKRSADFNISVNAKKRLMFVQVFYKKLFGLRECDTAFIDAIKQGKLVGPKRAQKGL